MELYKDGKNIHTHMIINNISEPKRRKLIKEIKNYYNLHNRTVVKLDVINYYYKFRDYLTKAPYGAYYYYIENKERTIKQIEDDLEKQRLKREKDKRDLFETDQIQYHLDECEIRNCNLCHLLSV